MGTWTNNDGLRILFGTDEGTTGNAGEYSTDGPERMVEVKITLTGLGTSAARVDEFVTIPKGARLHRAVVIAETAATSGGSAALNIGLQRLDRTTELDYDGIVAAAALTTIDAAGETTEYKEGSTAHGALLGTTLSNAGYITADYDTAAYTAGVIRVQIFYYVP